MNTTEIIDRITAILNDGAFTRTRILEELNAVALFIASVARLPGLVVADFPSGTTVNRMEVDLPDGSETAYHHNLFRVYSETYGYEVASDKLNRTTLYEGYSQSTTGPLESWCVENGKLLVRPKPSVNEDLLLSYYGKPETLSENLDVTGMDPDTPAWLDAEFHRPVFVSGVLAELFPLSDHPNRDEKEEKHANRMVTAVNIIEQKYPHAPAQRPNFRRPIKDF